MTRKRNKHRGGEAVVINMSIPSALNAELAKILARMGFKGPSDYFQARIRLDAGLNLRHEQEAVQP